MTVMTFDPEFINTPLVWTGKSLGVYLFFWRGGRYVHMCSLAYYRKLNFAYLWEATLHEIRNAIYVWIYVTCVHLCVNIQMWVYLWRFGAIVILTGREISFHSCCNETPYGGWSSVTLSSFSSVCLIFTNSFSSTFLPLEVNNGHISVCAITIIN